MEYFDPQYVRIILAGAMLCLATYYDLRKREVHDLLWIIFGIITLMSIISQYYDTAFLIKVGISVGIIVPTSFLLWRLGIFAGADAFSIMVLAGLVPFSTLTDSEITPFTTLTNAGFLATSVFLVNAARNTILLARKNEIFYGFDEPLFRKILAFFIGTKTSKPKYSFSIEKWVGNSKKFDFSLHPAETTEFCTKPHVWITPGIPFILYISLGFLTQIFFGDLFLFILNEIIMF